ncbi:hypothetical protein T11_11576 [Trichinella zimbabwensis]|uniref:Uncharacterized protein n=1 Tax=Trichinella zimbabwensis TaxID=268475 RepID=A0A0V1G9V2_9BILA|nr:hypothetical protein T11_11576 [Trichinella zimbabwensis]
MVVRPNHLELVPFMMVYSSSSQPVSAHAPLNKSCVVKKVVRTKVNDKLC